MNQEIISGKYEHPIIGIIGATQPLPGYNPREAVKLGYLLRQSMEKKGTLFTGGVHGVGVDIYRGIIDYCLEKNVSDKFFILFPDINSNPPEEYFNLAKKANLALKIEKAG